MKKLFILLLALSTSANADTVDKIRLFCSADGKAVYKSGDIIIGGSKNINCKVGLTYNYESKTIEGSYVCEDNKKRLLLMSEEISDKNTSLSSEWVKTSKNSSVLFDYVTYKDTLVEFKVALNDFYSYGRKVKFNMSYRNSQLKGVCLGITGTRETRADESL